MAISNTPSPLSNIIAAKTYNAQWFSGSTKEIQITAAIAAANTDGALYVYVPANMLPYNAASVTFNSSIRMLREGSDPSVFDVLAYGVAGTTDDMAALTAVYNAFNAAGGGTIDFTKAQMAVYPSSYGTAPGPASLFSFSGLTGIKLQASGAKFIGKGNFTLAGARAILFEFTNCNDIDIGDFVCTYTGQRNVDTDSNAMEQRGMVFAKFNNTCTNIRGGNLDVSDFSLGYWFTAASGAIAGTSADLALSKLGSRNIRIANIKALRTGYPLETDLSGHNMTANIDADSCGRSLILQDTFDFNIVCKSKNFKASQDAGISGYASGYVRYVNTETTDPTPGRCFGIHYPVDTGRFSRNVKIDLDIVAGAGVVFTRGFTLGLATGVSGAAVAADYILDNLEVSGSIINSSSSQPAWVVDFPAAWASGANLDNINFNQLKITGGASIAFDLRGLKNLAVLYNVLADSSLQLQGNATAQIVCINVKATEIMPGADASFIDLYSCNATTGATFSFTNKNLVGTYVAGSLYACRFWGGRVQIPIVLTASLPGAGAAENGRVLIEDAGAGDRNLIIYAGAQRFRIDGGPNV